MNQPQTTVNIQYNSRRQRSVLQDPNYGTATYKYNPFGELVEQVSPKNEISSYTYDILGRMLTQTELEGTTQWTYDETPGRIGTLQSVQNKLHQTSYVYDDLLRLTSAVETIEGNDYQTSYTYDVFGRVNSTTHPSGYAVKNVYNQYGYRTQIRAEQNNTLLWQTDEMNSMGQIADFRTGNALLTSREFEPETQRLTNVYTGKTGQNPVQNFAYQWYETGNLKQRHNAIHRLWEFFTYDDLNRLETIRLNGTILGDHHYDPDGLGNLIYKKADGQTLFSNAAYGENKAGPHALTSAETSAGIFPPEHQIIAYNSYDKAVSISEGNKQLQITYGHHRQRITQQYTDGSNTIAKLWAGACEYINQNGQQKTLTYLSGPEGVFALHIIYPNGSDSIRYIHKDHLGSWHTITDENGNLLQELSFDAWGSRRNPATWRAFTGTPPAPSFDRGFTGHEHLFGFSLVNMNGRIYDPLVSRMLSPDNFIQSPDFSQSFNRYSYVWNNPLVYTDPSGEIVWAPIIIGAVIGSYAGWQIGETAGAKGWSMVGYIAGGAAIGALSGGAASGVSALGGGAILTGAAGGAVGGAGFSGLATKWDGDAMVQGAFYGAVSGGFGGGIGAAIGGGAGAFAGGAVGSGINTALYGGSLDDIGISALMGGGMAFGAYHASSYIGWRFQGGKKWGDVDISYRQYTKMQADFQRSRFWRREYGGYLLEGGGVHRVPPGTNSQIDLGIAPDGAFAEYHTHWDRPGQVRYVDHSGNYVDPLQVALNTPVGEQAQVFKIITARYHGSWDLNTGGMDSFVINRYDASYYPGHGNYSVINPPINRFIYSFYFWLKR